MRLCNDVITVFNAAYDPVTDLDVYVPTVIKGVSWFLRDNVSVERAGLKNASTVAVRIPIDANFGGKKYTDPKTYAGLNSKAGFWTVQAGDVIVKGAVSGGTWRPATLAGAYSDCVTVLSVTDNRRAPNAPHWKVTGA